MRALALIALLATLFASNVAFAVTPDEMLKDPGLGVARSRLVARTALYGVPKPIDRTIPKRRSPRILRLLVRERLTQGDSDKQVLNFLVARYGEFVLLKPPFEWHTLLLWGLAPTTLIAGMIALVMLARRRTPPATTAGTLSPAEQQRLATLVEPGEVPRS